MAMPSPRRQTPEEVDLSSIQPPVKLGVTGAEQIARCLAGGSEEIKHLLRQECRIIYECCACSSLFRSLANFLAHKRVYCKDDHLLPSNDLASHVSILRQYIQTKAAAMATLAEGSNAGKSPDIAPPKTASTFPTLTPDKAGSGDMPGKESSKIVETPKRKKAVKCPCEGDKASSPITPDKQSPPDKAGSMGAKKRKMINENIKIQLKKSPNTKSLDKCINLLNGSADLSYSTKNDINMLNTSSDVKKRTPKKSPVGNADEKTQKSAVTTMTASTPLSKALDEKPKGGISPMNEIPIKPVKPKKKPTIAPHLLYPCLFCENVFPGTRMAIDHISSVHNKKKSLNVSKIRTKIRRKAFLWKSGKKMRRFQKKPKTDKEKDESSGKEDDKSPPSSPEKAAGQSPVDSEKVGKRGQASHKCPNCPKKYLYKASLDRHLMSCTSTTSKLDTGISGTDASSPSPTKSLSPGSPTPKPKHHSSPKPQVKKPASESLSTPSTPSNSSMNNTGDGIEKAKSEPNSPVQTPNSKIKPKAPHTAPGKTSSNGTTSSSGAATAESKATPLVIPERSEYPCPYCLIKPKKSFDMLFMHISHQHKDLRPSRKRVARFLINSGYKCTICKSPPRYFKNRVTLRKHKEREHGIAPNSPTKVTENLNINAKS